VTFLSRLVLIYGARKPRLSLDLFKLTRNLTWITQGSSRNVMLNLFQHLMNITYLETLKRVQG